MPIVTTSDIDRQNLLVVDGYATFTQSSFSITVDLDNRGGVGPYKHGAGTILKVFGGIGSLTKGATQFGWQSQTGVILDINSDQALVGYIDLIGLNSGDTLSLNSQRLVDLSPFSLNVSVANGDFTNILTNHKIIEAGVNTNTQLFDITGTLITPAVGDLITKITKLDDIVESDCNISFTLWYLVEEV